MEARSLASSLMILLVCMIGDASNPEGETLSTTSSLLIASVTILVTNPGPIVGIEMMDIRGVQWTENQELHENPLRKQI